MRHELNISTVARPRLATATAGKKFGLIKEWGGYGSDALVTCPGFSNGSSIREHAHTASDLGQVPTWDSGRKLVVNVHQNPVGHQSTN